MIQVRESARRDRLFDDPYAHLFAEAAEAAFTGSDAPEGATETWSHMQQLVDMFYEGRVIITKHFDDYLLDAVAAGCDQVVIIGAGLDTRALRLPFPRPITVFEVDLPPIFEFKERVLAGRARISTRRGRWTRTRPGVVLLGKLWNGYARRALQELSDQLVPTA